MKTTTNKMKEGEWNFVLVTKNILRLQKELSLTAQLIYSFMLAEICIAEFKSYNYKGTNEDIAKSLDIEEVRVSGCLDELVEKNLIEISIHAYSKSLPRYIILKDNNLNGESKNINGQSLKEIINLYQKFLLTEVEKRKLKK